MEKGSNPEQPVQSDFRVMLHNIIRDGQNGLLSFEDVRARCRLRAIALLEQSEEGQKFLAMNLALSSPEQ